MTDTAVDKSYNDQDAHDSYTHHTEIVEEYLGAVSIADSDEDLETGIEMLEGMMLSREVSKVIDVCLGTGGPGVHILYHIVDKEIRGITFKYLDWFYMKELIVAPGSKEWSIWEDFAQYSILDLVEGW